MWCIFVVFVVFVVDVLLFGVEEVVVGIVVDCNGRVY